MSTTTPSGVIFTRLTKDASGTEYGTQRDVRYLLIAEWLLTGEQGEE